MAKQKQFFITIYILLLLSFISLSVFIANHHILKLDIDISKAIQVHSRPWLDKVMIAISLFGELPWSIISVILVAALFYLNKYKREAYFIVLIVFSGLIILGVKNLVGRPRPTDLYVRLVEFYRFQSYPSGHVLSYVLFFGFLIVLMQNLKTISKIWRNLITIISLFLILTIIPSRIYLGAHWFTDTVGGVLLGLICLFPLCFFYLKKQ